ncbi:hypothetical protein [Cupriavidus necator]
MQFHDYYLKFVDRDASRAALLAAGLTVEYTDDEGEMKRAPAQGVNLSSIGVISTGGEYAEDGTIITPPTEIPGWHVNLRLSSPLGDEQLATLGAAVIDPAPVSPYRVWA